MKIDGTSVPEFVPYECKGCGDTYMKPRGSTRLFCEYCAAERALNDTTPQSDGNALTENSEFDMDLDASLDKFLDQLEGQIGYIMDGYYAGMEKEICQCVRKYIEKNYTRKE